MQDEAQRLIAEYLAKGGEVRRMERGARSEVIAPAIKKRQIMSRLKAKAAEM